MGSEDWINKLLNEALETDPEFLKTKPPEKKKGKPKISDAEFAKDMEKVSELSKPIFEKLTNHISELMDELSEKDLSEKIVANTMLSLLVQVTRCSIATAVMAHEGEVDEGKYLGLAKIVARQLKEFPKEGMWGFEEND